MTTRRTPIPAGVTIPTPCPACGGRLGWHGALWALACDGCALRLTTTAQEANEIALYLACPGLLDVPLETYLRALLAVHHLAIVPVAPAPQVISTRPTPATHKARVLPLPGETAPERAERLAAQAELNGITVTPIRWTAAGVPVGFLVTSGERDADNRPVRHYDVEVSAFRAACPCRATGLCSHLLAVKDWLLEWDAAERTRSAPPPAAQAPGAYRNTGKYADLWMD